MNHLCWLSLKGAQRSTLRHSSNCALLRLMGAGLKESVDGIGEAIVRGRIGRVGEHIAVLHTLPAHP